MSSSIQGRFARVPVDVFMDKRLVYRHIRVLIALYLFADKDGFCFPKRRTLSELTGIRTSSISLITTQLEEFGWLTKTGNGGKSRACRYRLKMPKQTVPALSKVHQKCTVPKTSPRIEQTNELNNNDNRSPFSPPLDSVSQLLDDRIAFQLWFEKHKNRFCHFTPEAIEAVRLIYVLYNEHPIPSLLEPSRMNRGYIELLEKLIQSHSVQFIVKAYQRHCLGIPEKENFGYLLKGACLIEQSQLAKTQKPPKKKHHRQRSSGHQQTKNTYQKVVSGETDIDVIGNGLGLFPNKKINSIN